MRQRPFGIAGDWHAVPRLVRAPHRLAFRAASRTVEKARDLAVDLAAQPRYLALRDASHAHRPDQFVDRARRDALDVGLLDHCRQRLFSQPTRLEEAWKIAALAQLWD